MTNIYNQIKQDLTSKEKFHIKLGLERVQEMLELLGNPQNEFKTIHIAGTNGKGSTASILAKMLEKAGYKTGLFTSPHLIRYNERIKISSKDIPDEELKKLLELVNSKAKANDIPLTEFEIITIIAFLYFKEQKADIAVIEVGLGGRLDATNIINPEASVITSIGLDHTQRLGNTIDEIAFEKAGIIKENIPVICSENNLGHGVIQKVAKQNDANVFFADEVQEVEFKNKFNHIKIKDEEYQLSLFGDFQSENLSLALKTLEVLNIPVCKEVLKNVSWGARMQFLEDNVILDGAHNPDSATKLINSIDNYFPNLRRTWFFGALSNKDYYQVMDTLFRDGDKVYLVIFNHQGSEEFDNIGFEHEKINIKDFIAKYNQVKKQDELVIIAGSLYLAGDILALLANT